MIGGRGGLGPAYTRGEAEKPAGTRNMGTFTSGVYTAEQQARLGVNVQGNNRQPMPTGSLPGSRVLGAPPTGSTAARVLGTPAGRSPISPTGSRVLGTAKASAKTSGASPTISSGARAFGGASGAAPTSSNGPRALGATSGAPRAGAQEAASWETTGQGVPSLGSPTNKSSAYPSALGSRVLGAPPVASVGNPRICGGPASVGPAWARGETEAPAGTKNMGTWTSAVYTAEQQARLGVDELGVVQYGNKKAETKDTGVAPSGGKLILSYGAGSLKLGYGDPAPGKLNLGYGSRGKLELSYGRQAPPVYKGPTAQTGKLDLGYAQGKLQLAYKGRTPETGKLNLSYGAQGKLNLAYGASQSTTAAPPQSGSAQTGKLNLGYAQGKLQLAYQSCRPETGKLILSYGAPGKLNLSYGASQPTESRAVQGKLNFAYGGSGKLNASYNAKEGAASKPVQIQVQQRPVATTMIKPTPLVPTPVVQSTLKAIVPDAKRTPAFVQSTVKEIVPDAKRTPAPVQSTVAELRPKVAIDVTTLAVSGDGSVENVGIKLDAPLQCKNCRQRFVSEQALQIHWRFIHDPNRHQED